MSNEFFEDDKKTEKEISKETKAAKHDFSAIKKPNKKIVFALILILVFAGTIYFSAEWALDALIHTRAEVPVPDIAKKSVSNGLDLLASSNLAMKKAGEEFAAGVPAGFVVRQVPAAGSIVREGRVIRVWVSQGTETIQMPNLVGMTLRNAQLTLRQMGLTPGTTTSVFSLTAEKGNVTAQSFPQDAPINKGDIVNLTVSNGAPEASMLLMPDFRQKKLTDATRWASQNNIELDVTDDPNSLFPNGTITFQSPDMDHEVKLGSTVKLTVSRRKVEGEEKTHRIHYELAQGKNNVKVRVVVIDQAGEREVLNQSKAPGSKIDLEVPYGGEAKVRIYVNDILVRERDMK